MNYLDFRKWFDEKIEGVSIPADAKELLGPSFTVTGSQIWTLDWILEFGDGKYLRIREHYAKERGLIGMSRRESFAYHYGPISGKGPDGLPVRNSGDAVDIRIDNSQRPAHMHYGSPNPHHPQSSVNGLDMTALDLFTFMGAIFKHRETGKSIEKVLGFAIR